MKHIHHIHIFILVGLLSIFVILIATNSQTESSLEKNPIIFGVSYSPEYATSLGLDPKKTYLSILNELNAKNLRLNAYWNEIELKPDKFNFQDLDWYINQATNHSAQVILAIGYKLPRWPECRAPKWVDQASLRTRELNMLKAVISHFDQNTTITAYQLENEPLLDFGVCPKVDREFLVQEVHFVKNLTHKPIILTDSGELRPWRTPMQLSDIFGTTLYRVIDSPWVGPFQYPLRPWFYRVKSDLIRTLFAQGNQKTIIAELQAEPWAQVPLTQLPVEIQVNRFSLSSFKETVQFSKKTGFSESYLWGVEWWYYLAAHGHSEYLEYAKGLF